MIGWVGLSLYVTLPLRNCPQLTHMDTHSLTRSLAHTTTTQPNPNQHSLLGSPLYLPIPASA